ncbi:RnfABCDGE type electron transport complex subunit D [Paenibacillus sp. BSR1-1]|uniref:RnfABCDGE type electron transport complex subunit D n=1 Tax=Paenibacillus sp. BSR1-1 TaxID=3020845 RepID=UPI0025B238CA|nr:RnfABCDGE type electron transport complex subunit D [Paenibacillus sp. BSR1-1]MDN3017339.1 RnfABCDGE type electron transport complex subunit D [Paenibacillus sp. BSR1-1]
MEAKKWMKTPKGYVAIAMTLYLVIASIGSLTWMGIKNSFISVSAALITDYIYCAIFKRKIGRDSTVITGLIISLILNFTTSSLVVAATAIIAILSKHLLVYKKKPIFNPAAFGLFINIFIFQTGQSWWGAFGDLPVWTMIFVLVGGYLVTDRVMKYPQLLSYLGTSFVLLFFMGLLNIGDASDALRPPFINAALFFAFFMLTDPPTSPAKNKNQVIFGILVAVSGTIVYGLFGGLTYLYVGAFIGNLYNYLNKRISYAKSAAKIQRVNSGHRALGK